MLDEGNLRAARKAVVDAARGLADGNVLFVEGVRQLAALRFGASRLDQDQTRTRTSRCSLLLRVNRTTCRRTSSAVSVRRPG